MTRIPLLLLGGAATIACAVLFHGPLGAGDRMADRAEVISRRTLDYYELPQVQARLERSPMTRRLILSGPANDFQHSELVRILDQVPGVLDVRWDPASPPVAISVAP